MVRPKFPDNSQTTPAQGTVVLDLVVDEMGNVRDVQVVSGSRDFVPAAVQAVRKWKYQPYAVDGQPIEMSTRVTLNFRRNQ
jgi:protein TonB